MAVPALPGQLRVPSHGDPTAHAAGVHARATCKALARACCPTPQAGTPPVEEGALAAAQAAEARTAESEDEVAVPLPLGSSRSAVPSFNFLTALAAEAELPALRCTGTSAISCAPGAVFLRNLLLCGGGKVC